MTTVRLSTELERKIAVLMESEKITKTEIIKRAISEYYKQQIEARSPYETGKELFGRFGSDEDLSVTYKQKLRKSLHEKHAH